MTSLLVVDDQAGIRGMLKMLFQHLGYEVILKETGNEAIEAYQEADVVITDYLLPNLTGAEIVKKIRERSQLPVIVMSGLIDEVKQELIGIPNVFFIEKPFSIKLMEELVREALIKTEGLSVAQKI